MLARDVRETPYTVFVDTQNWEVINDCPVFMTTRAAATMTTAVSASVSVSAAELIYVSMSTAESFSGAVDAVESLNLTVTNK